MIEGKFGISAKVICDSVSEAGIRLLTFEITYPRIVLSETNTHRALSKNSASSRAIPFAKMKENLTGRPVRFGAANPGMQDTGEDFDAMVNGYPPEEWWRLAQLSATRFSEEFYEAGYAKQVYNRLTEPFQMMKTVLSGTELENFFWLRDDGAADPSLAELARCMREAKDASIPNLLNAGEWHLPYVKTQRGSELYYISDETPDNAVYIKLEDAIKMSAARCAAVSFRNTDYGLEKCRQVYERLVGDDRKHASALEHQATPIGALDRGFTSGKAHNLPYAGDSWQEGISHCDRQGQLWSGNFRGFIQHRKLVAGENKTEY